MTDAELIAKGRALYKKWQLARDEYKALKTDITYNDFLIDEWLKYVERGPGFAAMATVCYIAAHNYYVYNIVKAR